MVKVEEATMSQAMSFAFEEFIQPILEKNGASDVIDYRPKSKANEEDSSWSQDNPTTGLLYLKKHPNAKVAWVLVKFEQRTDKKFGQHAKYDNSVKINSPEKFKEFFGVEPANEWPTDMVVYARWNKKLETNKYAYRDFDETTPNFYMYTNHIRTNLDVVIKRLMRINEIIETNPKAIIGNQFNIPYSATNIKM